MVTQKFLIGTYVVFGVCLFFLCVPPIGYAYVPLVVEQESQSDVRVIENPETEQYFYGRLNDFPHTYEIQAVEPFTLHVEVLVPEVHEAKDIVNGIIIKQEGRQGRVVEIARMLAVDASWEPFYEPWGGDSYRRGTSFTSEVSPGTYRIEVSTPDNLSPYALVVGTEDERGDVSYTEMVRRIADVKEFYGRSPITVVVSPYVYLPLLVLVLLVGGTIWYRRRS